jgi:hypothetical protein
LERCLVHFRQILAELLGVNEHQEELPAQTVHLPEASAFGSPAALYENFLKFVSIFPLYHMLDYTEDKTNKASFEERASLV